MNDDGEQIGFISKKGSQNHDFNDDQIIKNKPERDLQTVKDLNYGDGFAFYNGQCAESQYATEGKNNKGRLIREGKGKMVWPSSGSFYDGEWLDNQPNGQGIYEKRESKGKVLISRYEGSILAGKAHGSGKYEEYENRKQLCYSYQGEWRGNLQHGKGIEERQSDGIFYDGEFFEGKKHGKGLIKFQSEFSKSTYNGQWKEDEFHGKGKYIWDEGEREYDGEWESGVMTGYGTMTYSDGRTYEGFFKADQFHGKGKYTWPTTNLSSSPRKPTKTSWYEGEFHEGNLHGIGIYKPIDGPERKSKWDNGKFVGWL